MPVEAGASNQWGAEARLLPVPMLVGDEDQVVAGTENLSSSVGCPDSEKTGGWSADIESLDLAAMVRRGEWSEIAAKSACLDSSGGLAAVEGAVWPAADAQRL